MNRPPLGQVCIELGLLEEAQVEGILRDMREHGQGRFGELAVGLNQLSEEDLARALAHQFDLTRLSAERVARLDVPKDVLALLPTALMRSRVLLPTFFDPERRILSVVTSDPTDLPALQIAQRHARADRLRIFVAARSAIAARLDRLLPATDPDEITSPSFEPPPRSGGTVVLEPDVEVASALRRLERAEGARTEIVPDPEQVTSLLTAGMADRVLYRQAHQGTAAPYLPIWRGARPGVHIASVQGFGPGQRVAVSYHQARSFYQELLLWLLSATEPRQLHERQRMRSSYRLAIALGTEAGLSQESLELLSLAAMLANIGELSLLGRQGVVGPTHALNLYDEPSQLLERFDPPWGVSELYAALDRRVNRPSELTERLDVEVLLAVRAAVELGTAGHTEAGEVLPQDTTFHPRAVEALTRVLQRQALRAQLLTGGQRQALVLLAVREVALMTELERRLDALGPQVIVAPSVELALARVRELRPAAVVVEGGLPDLDGDRGGPRGALRLLAEIRHDTPLSDTPVFCLTGDDAPASPAALDELGATRVFSQPLDLGSLDTAILQAIAAPDRGETRSASATGQSSLLPVREVVEILRRSGQTAEIRLVAPEVQGSLYLVEGELKWARLGRREGLDAWELARELPHVRYAVAFGVEPAELAEEEPTPGEA